jgi:type IV pilus assembly protein PilB
MTYKYKREESFPYAYMSEYEVVTTEKSDEVDDMLYLIHTDKLKEGERSNIKNYILPGKRLGIDYEYIEDNNYFKVILKVAKKLSEEDTPEVEDGGSAELTEEQKRYARKFLEQIVRQAKDEKASDIHIEKYEKNSRVRFRIDGVLIETNINIKIESEKWGTAKFYQNFDNIVRVIMLDSDIDTNSRVPEDGQLVIKGSNSDKNINLRVSVLPTKFGRRVVMRILDAGEQFTIEQLKFDDDEKQLIKAIESPQGMVLVTGPTGSGKSTTLFAVLRHINKPGVNILTAENPVEFSLDGVGQVNIREDIGLSFSATLRSFLRQDPDVIMVGEIRDKETGNIAIKAALTGHLVLSTLHTNDAVSTVMRLVNMGIEPYLITEAVSLVVAQRLARKICKNCKVEDKSVTHAELKSIGLTDKIKLYKGKGCSECGQTGSKGRKGIYEVLGLDADFIKGVLGKESKSNADLLKIAKGSGFKTMRDKGKKMVTLGEISLKELNRILAPESE